MIEKVLLYKKNYNLVANAKINAKQPNASAQIDAKLPKDKDANNKI
jgi:hypothetical protein